MPPPFPPRQTARSPSTLRFLVLLPALFIIGHGARAGDVWVSPDANFTTNLKAERVREAPDWSPELPLPLSLADAVEAARRRLGTVTKDAKDWFVYDLTLDHNLPNAPLKWTYEITLCRVAADADQRDACKVDGYARLEVAMNGKVGTLAKRASQFLRWSRDGACATLPYQQSSHFTVHDNDIRSTSLPRQVILDGPDWKLNEPMPLDIAHAARRALDEAAKLVDDAPQWSIHSLSLQVSPGTSSKWCYTFSITRTLKEHPGANDGEMVIQVTLDGKLGLPQRRPD